LQPREAPPSRGFFFVGEEKDETPVGHKYLYPGGGRHTGGLRRRSKCDLLIRGANVVNLLAGRVDSLPVAVHRGRVIALEDLAAREVFQAKGLYLAPGFADCHIHVESTMLTPSEFARAVVKRGTAAAFADPREIVSALGEAGLRFMLDASEGIPLDIFSLLPSCVPATPFETSGGVLTSALIRKYRAHARVVGLAEFMNFPAFWRLTDPVWRRSAFTVTVSSTVMRPCFPERRCRSIFFKGYAPIMRPPRQKRAASFFRVSSKKALPFLRGGLLIFSIDPGILNPACAEDLQTPP
jgi:hypothetical protein